MINRHDGVFDRKLNCVIHTWRDVARNLVGFVYIFDEDRVYIVYFSPGANDVKGTGMSIHMHITRTRHVDDPTYIAGYKIETPPDPETDQKLDSLALPEDCFK